MSKNSFFLIFLAFCSGCFNKQTEIITPDEAVVDLYNSTKIIKELLHTKQLSKILEPSTPQELELLITNFSPAEMAFEAEVLNSEQLSILFFTQKTDPLYQILHALFEQKAREFVSIKFVEIDTELLFKLAQTFNLSDGSTLLLMHARQEVARFEHITDQTISDAINMLRSTHLNSN